jgi:hypothetical protein
MWWKLRDEERKRGGTYRTENARQALSGAVGKNTNSPGKSPGNRASGAPTVWLKMLSIDEMEVQQTTPL